MNKWETLGAVAGTLVVTCLLLGAQYLTLHAYEKCLEVQKTGCVR